MSGRWEGVHRWLGGWEGVGGLGGGMGFVARGIREVGGGALQGGLGRLDGVGELSGG